jgi:predicted nucleic acid-binding protein
VNALLIDTSVWVSYFKGDSFPEIDLALKEGRVYTTGLVASELLSGVFNSKEKKQLEAFLKELPLCDASFDHWCKVGALRAKLIQKGFSISTPDAHIAQSAIDLECYLYSSDKIFGKISDKIDLKIYQK